MTLLTFWHGARPFAVLLTGGDGLAVHHESAMAVELDHVAGLVVATPLDVAVLRTLGRLADHLCKSITRSVTQKNKQPIERRTFALGRRVCPVSGGQTLSLRRTDQ